MAGEEGLKAYKNKPVDPVQGETPDSNTVRKFHTNADTDGSEGSIHHTLGPGHHQAAAGDHDHRGGGSVALLEGHTIEGDRSDGTALVSIIALLVELGAKDNTVA